MKTWVAIILCSTIVGNRCVGQTTYKIDRQPMCWVTPSAIDSSLNRYTLLSSRTGATSQILQWTNANGEVVDVSAGGAFWYGYCDECSRDTLPVPRIESFVVSQPIFNPFNPTDCGSAITAYIYGVQSESEIDLEIDGSPVSFTYDPITKYIFAEVHYATGSGVHNVTLTATILTGTAIKNGSFDCG